MSVLKTLFHGMLIGIANIIPGVSGGTMAVVLGIYDKLINSISGFFSRSIKASHFTFLFQIGFGAILGIFLFSRVVANLLEFHMVPTHFFFLGLIIGSFPVVYTSYKDMKIDLKKGISFCLGASVVFSLWFFPTSTFIFLPGQELTLFVRGFLFFSGIIATSAMVLPGISGSFVLLLMGSYGVILSAVSELNFDILLYVAMGGFVGLILFSKFISFALSRFPARTYYFILGLMMGSIFKIWPGLPSGMLALYSFLAFGVGVVLTFLLKKNNVKTIKPFEKT
jgi:putative membrane protein